MTCSTPGSHRCDGTLVRSDTCRTPWFGAADPAGPEPWRDRQAARRSSVARDRRRCRLRSRMRRAAGRRAVWSRVRCSCSAWSDVSWCSGGARWSGAKSSLVDSGPGPDVSRWPAEQPSRDPRASPLRPGRPLPAGLRRRVLDRLRLAGRRRLLDRLRLVGRRRLVERRSQSACAELALGDRVAVMRRGATATTAAAAARKSRAGRRPTRPASPPTTGGPTTKPR